MKNIEKGDIVARKSYGKDIIFMVKDIIYKSKNQIAILRGIIERIEVDSEISDLIIIDRKELEERLQDLENKVESRIQAKIENKKCKLKLVSKDSRTNQKVLTGKILHLDGDKKYSEKSYRYYKKMGLRAVVKNIPEYKQSKLVYRLLEAYNPDILVITGHDGMIKKGIRYNDIYNYRNSKYFIETVKEARRYDQKKGKNLVIFAGACQSYFEALISAGANFASSPARILIDFLDPLVVAEKIAITEKYKYISIDDIAYELRDGKKGISGIGANGKMLIE